MGFWAQRLLMLSKCVMFFFFKGMEKSEAKERRELSEGDVLLSSPLLDVHEAEDAKHRSGNCGKSK